MPDPPLLFVATTNPGKLRDFAHASTGRIRLEPLPNLNAIPAPAEDEPTFQANAALKARFYSTHAPGEIVLADDSGLEVDALHGHPGVRSARFAEDHAFPAPPGTSLDERNNLCLLHALSAHPPPYPARYRCTLAAARDGHLLATADGTVEGLILPIPRGHGGFGYDPHFFLEAESRTMAELDPATRLTLSHRGRALRALLDQADLSLGEPHSRYRTNPSIIAPIP